MTKFKNKYRIESNRLEGWDYGSNALYFITICCKNREYFFGNILEGKMHLSEIGKMAEKYWLEIPQHFPFVILHKHVLMPNHVHGIIEIAKNDEHNDGRNVETQNFASLPPTLQPQPIKHHKNKFGPQSKNLASIIRGFKIGVTKNARLWQKTQQNDLQTQNIVSIPFAWQPNYHDHIIRNKKSYQNIANYIIENPMKWNDDRFNPKHPNPNK